MKTYYWTGISHEERTKSIHDVKGIIDHFATILNFQRFSDISLSLLLELEENKLKDLHLQLNQIVLLKEQEPESTDSNAFCLVFLNITFSKGSGNLRIEVPNIPE